MIPLDRYPKEITLRDDTHAVLRPMIPGMRTASGGFCGNFPRSTRRISAKMWTSERWWIAGRSRSTTMRRSRFWRCRGTASWKRHALPEQDRLETAVGIVRILIAPDFRHKGLGTAMIREIRYLGEKAALNYLLAEVIEEQQAAVRALERMGFEKAFVHRKFVNDRQDVSTSRGASSPHVGLEGGYVLLISRQHVDVCQCMDMPFIDSVGMKPDRLCPGRSEKGTT